MKSYQDFLKQKLPKMTLDGVTDPKLPKVMKPFQRAATKWALRRKRSALFAGTGLGKTLKQLVWADNVSKHEQGDVLILTPLAVAEQTVREAEKFGIKGVKYSSGDTQTSITVTNYDRLEKFDVHPKDFCAVVLDECFASGTLVDTLSGEMPIEKISEGCIIKNAVGLDIVVKTKKREVNYAVKVIAKNASFIASPNHPIFTERGWVAAQTLKRGDKILETASALPLVRGDFCSEECSELLPKILQSFLLGEMENEYTRTQSESTQQGSVCQAGKDIIQLVQNSRRPSTEQIFYRENSHAGNECSKEGVVKRVFGEEIFYKAERRKWGRANSGRDFSEINTYWGLVYRISNIFRKAHCWLSNLLQGGYWKSKIKDSNRGRWFLSFIGNAKDSGQKEGCKIGFARVDCIEVLEQGHPELERCRNAEGKLYFYDLQAARHPSFSVNGLLVHNSSIIKHDDSKTRAALIETFAETPWKLCCTATPAPNDYVEIGSHSEFLGILDQQEMLAEFFVHEGAIRAGDAEADWRLKRHAEADFWRWMSTWALVYNSPDDLGFPDKSYILPELRRHIIEVDFERKPAPGQLFASGKMSLRERMDMRKQTTNARCEAAAKLINADPKSSWLIWCGRNDEADYLEKLIKDSLQVSGSMDRGMKASRLLGFTENDPRIMVTKPSIAGWGMNWQHCHKMVFVGLNDSFEQLYQAVRRCWRFGQQYPVDIWLVSSTAEYAVLKNVLDKEQRALSMYASMRELSRLAVQSDDVTGRRESKYTKFNERMPEWL